MHVNVVCRNLTEDRVIPRFGRYLRDVLGWSLTARPDPAADVVYLSGYFEWPLVATLLSEGPLDYRHRPKLAAYFTHREEQPPGNAKARLFDQVAGRVDLRIATAAMYAETLSSHGATAQIRPPVERERFTIPGSATQRNKAFVAGFSGYTYSNGRKGEALAKSLLARKHIEWRASGRGWPVPTRRYTWQEMPAFYQSLDVLVVTATVEGVPMPPLEALACGVSVVVPRGVGLLDELPDTPGIHRYERGSAGDLARAFGEALELRPDVDREALRAVTEPYTVEGWCEQHRLAFEEAFELEPPAAPVKEIATVTTQKTSLHPTRGIYCVAFGEPARACAVRMMETAKQHLPEIPIALVAACPIGLEDVFIQAEDSDVGGRRAKLRAYELSPFETTLYLDADTEVVGDIRLYFQLVEDGWEFVICKDPHLMDTMKSFQRANNLAETREIEQELYTLNTLQFNGGVWAFGRGERVAAFFRRWQAEWEKHAGRDQGALIRAMYADPLKVIVLGNEWNTFPKYMRGVTTAGLMHYPGRARRWSGLLPRLDSPAAWARVQQFEAKTARKPRGSR